MSPPSPHLAESFLARWKGARSDEGNVAEALQAAWASGASAHPSVEVSAQEFAAFLADRAPTDVAAADAVSSLRAEDLFLSCGCARGFSSAIAVFEARHLSRVPAWIGHLRPSPQLVDEVRQRLRHKLFVADEDEPPRITQYGGHGPLDAWVRVAAVRTALHVMEAEQPRTIDEPAALEDAVAAGVDPELDYLKARYRGEFLAALKEAMAALPRRDRVLLRFHYLERLTPERIATMYDVHRTTVMRWLDAAEAQVLAETRARVISRLGLSDSECDSLLAMVRSRLHVTLHSILRTSIAQD